VPKYPALHVSERLMRSWRVPLLQERKWMSLIKAIPLRVQRGLLCELDFLLQHRPTDEKNELELSQHLFGTRQSTLLQ